MGTGHPFPGSGARQVARPIPGTRNSGADTPSACKRPPGCVARSPGSPIAARVFDAELESADKAAVALASVIEQRDGSAGWAAALACAATDFCYAALAVDAAAVAMAAVEHAARVKETP